MTATTTSYYLSDGNANQTAETLADAVRIAADWYDFLLDGDYELDTVPSMDKDGITDIHSLNRAIGRWENAIAEACGKKAFHGHGNYSVSAASEMGLNLVAREVKGE